MAETGLEKLKKHVDTLIVIPNDRLLAVANAHTNLSDAFRLADNVLRQSIQVVSDLITSPGLINLDFADVRSVLSQKGATMMSVGAASGSDRAIKAAEQVIYSPLLDQSITGARGMLINLTAGYDLNLWEVEQATQMLRSTVHPDADLMFGTVLDEAMGEELRITVIASGFDDQPLGQPLPAPRVPQTAPTLAAEVFARSLKELPVREGTAVLAAAEEKSREGTPASRWRFSLKGYAVPAFLQPH
jgi:cell division protein FtsZ